MKKAVIWDSICENVSPSGQQSAGQERRVVNGGIVCESHILES